MNKTRCLCICGPTASGKTSLAIELAKRLNGEIISADSMQIYRGLPISTAQPTVSEMQEVPHHLIGFLDPCEPFSAARYVELATPLVQQLHEKGKLPILCGGTGWYMRALLEGRSFGEDLPDPRLRAELNEMPALQLYEKLQQIDPVRAAQLHPNDKKRVCRAVEQFYQTGKTPTQLLEESVPGESPYDALLLCLNFHDRQKLYDRIGLRAQAMLQDGLCEEIRLFWQNYEGTGTAAQAIGPKELLPWIKGECSLEEAMEVLCRETRRYAKRQLTWLRSQKDAVQLFVDGQTPPLQQTMEILKERNWN
ncbi:MAG: tRNA (adenosine(37)-N6)-dimethylallyltransferase MiaA [Clostridia bacterium]|nr:tRNA (adenosine(37)-N6)-dimethylallyltransferase MiaA [Clostridia bacterium]